MKSLARSFSCCALTGLVLCFCGSAPAAVLYTENFDADHTANWTVNNGPGTNASNFFFDYSTVGIPSAPGAGGSTRGLKLQANIGSGIFGGLSVSPTGQSFTAPYVMEFDMWLNFNGPAPVGGSGSTQIAGAGIGTAGNVAQWAGGTQDSIHFSATLDGNSSADFRAYSPSAAGVTSYTDTAPGIYAAGAVAGSRNGSNAYYSVFTPTTAPAAQTVLFPQQTGATLLGSIGFAWRHITITNDLTNAYFSIDGRLIATVPLSEDTVAGSNILLNYYDSNAGSSTDPNAGALLFGLYDNLRVSDIPEPSAAVLAAMGVVFAAGRRRRPAKA